MADEASERPGGAASENEELVFAPRYSPAQLEPVNWPSLAQEQRASYLLEVNKEFAVLTSEFALSANLCVNRFEGYSTAHRRWKWTLILTAGAVALLNLLATNKSIVDLKYHPFPLMAAFAAIVLTVLANLDSFSGAGERAQAYREARELFIDAQRQLDNDWDSFVRPLGDAPDACRNATEMYRRAVAIDRELRARFRKLTTIPERK